jgi:hypothetical protein
MDARIASFTLGCGFGAAAIVVLRHELPLAARAQTVGALGALGLLFAIVTWTWARRLRRVPGGPGEARPWTIFVWSTALLLLLYLALVTAVLFE